MSGISDQGLFPTMLLEGRMDSRLCADTEAADKFINSFLGLPSSSLSSSLNSEIKGASNRNHTAQSSLDDSVYNFGQQLEHIPFDISASEHEFDASGPFGWDISTESLSPTRDNACQCLESALSVTISIERQGRAFPYPGAIDLALDVEAQLREAVPLAVQCSVCKARQGEILNMFSNAMANVVDLFQQLCNVELFGYSESPDLQQRASMLESIKWFQPKPSGRASVSNSQQLVPHNRSISTSTSHNLRTSNGGGLHRTANDTGTYSRKLPSPSKTSSTDQLRGSTNANTKLGGWRILVGRHLIVGDERKCVLIHLLRRRLSALSNALEGLIRAMQDLRTALKRVNSFNSRDDDESNRVADIDTRRPMKTASKLYDIIDQLEKMQI